jgi:hypothetical protein
VDTPKTLLASIAMAAVAILAPTAALAETVVPPGNSAANQYTETFPTTGGNAEAKKGKHKVTPAEAIGSGPAKKLDSQGKQGREAAAVIAATAPAPVGATGEVSDEGSGSAAGAGGKGGGGGAGQGGGSEGGGQGPAPIGNGSAGAARHVNVVDSAVEEPGGSSGFGEVLGQATGSTSSGGTGLLLPLAILATVLWAVFFLLRRKRRTA